MKLIADSNIIYSALLSNDNICQFIILAEALEFFSPNFMVLEIFKHKEKIKLNSKLSEEEIITQYERILSRITFIKEEVIPTSCYFDAYKLCKDLDKNDIPFVALTIFLDGILLTRDKVIYNGLKAQNFNVMSIQDLSQHINF
jgi:predicted nucleic acid-binding protein